MNSQEWDTRRLDIAAFTRAGAELGGGCPVTGFERLVESTVRDALLPDAQVEWSAHGELRAPAGRTPEHWLRLVASTRLPLQCQRCLAPVETTLRFDHRILFVADEETAERLDDERDEDVLALPRSLDLRVLLEDELLLEMPLVPRHEVCPEPLVNAAADVDAESDAPNPFGVLAAWKREPPSS